MVLVDLELLYLNELAALQRNLGSARSMGFILQVQVFRRNLSMFVSARIQGLRGILGFAALKGDDVINSIHEPALGLSSFTSVTLYHAFDNGRRWR